MITKDTFRRLVIAIRDKGEVDDRKINGSLYKVCEISEMTLILSKHERGWAPEGITFELFGAEFFLTTDGSISIIENENEDNEEIYSLDDQALVSVVSSFLKWRVTILEKLDV